MKGKNIQTSGAGARVCVCEPNTKTVFTGSKSLQGTFDWMENKIIFNSGDRNEVTLWLYLHQATGKVWFDDISIESESDIIHKKKNKNLIDNAGFDAGLQGWLLRSAKHTDKDGRVKPGAIVMSGYSATNLPVAGLLIPIPGGFEYTFSAWIKDDSRTAKIQFSFLDKNGKIIFNYYTHSPVPGVWNYIELKNRAPKDAVSAQFYLRMFSPGTAYFDDVSFTYGDLAFCDFSVTPMVYYTSEKSPKIKELFSFNVEDEKTLSGNCVEIQAVDLKTGATLYKSGKIPASACNFSNEFTITGNTKCMITGRVVNSRNKELFKTNETIFAVDVPATLKNGYFEVEGKPFFPICTAVSYLNPDTSASSAAGEIFQLLKNAGFNTVGYRGMGETAGLSNFLNFGLSKGLRFVIPLYGNMKVKENYSNSREKMTALKDHPAVLLYKFQDEPDIWNTPPFEMIGLRQILNECDKNHGGSSELFSTSKLFDKYSYALDVIQLDPYPKSKTPEPITMIRDWIDGAKKAGKPVFITIQAFDDGGFLEPTPAELENYVYQSLGTRIYLVKDI